MLYKRMLWMIFDGVAHQCFPLVSLYILIVAILSNFFTECMNCACNFSLDRFIFLGCFSLNWVSPSQPMAENVYSTCHRKISEKAFAVSINCCE